MCVSFAEVSIVFLTFALQPVGGNKMITVS